VIPDQGREINMYIRNSRKNIYTVSYYVQGVFQCSEFAWWRIDQWYKGNTYEAVLTNVYDRVKFSAGQATNPDRLWWRIGRWRHHNQPHLKHSQLTYKTRWNNWNCHTHPCYDDWGVVTRLHTPFWRIERLWDFRFSRRRIWRWLSSGMLRRAGWQKFTDVTELFAVSITRAMRRR
jgi:hypothetical protein